MFFVFWTMVFIQRITQQANKTAKLGTVAFNLSTFDLRKIFDLSKILLFPTTALNRKTTVIKLSNKKSLLTSATQSENIYHQKYPQQHLLRMSQDR